MAVYEIVRDIDVRLKDNTALIHYYGRRPGHRGQIIVDNEIKKEHLEYILQYGKYEEVGKKKVETAGSKEEKEKYHCKECHRNHEVDSGIGIKHIEYKE